jgi:hypothetical protein
MDHSERACMASPNTTACLLKLRSTSTRLRPPMQEASVLLRYMIVAAAWVQALVTTVAQPLELLRTPAPLPAPLLDSAPSLILSPDQETSTKAPTDSQVAKV